MFLRPKSKVCKGRLALRQAALGCDPTQSTVESWPPAFQTCASDAREPGTDTAFPGKPHRRDCSVPSRTEATPERMLCSQQDRTGVTFKGCVSLPSTSTALNFDLQRFIAHEGFLSMTLASLFFTFLGSFCQRSERKTSFSLSRPQLFRFHQPQPNAPCRTAGGAPLTQSARGETLATGVGGKLGAEPRAGAEARDDLALRSCLAIGTHQISSLTEGSEGS